MCLPKVDSTPEIEATSFQSRLYSSAISINVFEYGANGELCFSKNLFRTLARLSSPFKERFDCKEAEEPEAFSEAFIVCGRNKEKKSKNTKKESLLFIVHPLNLATCLTY